MVRTKGRSRRILERTARTESRRTQEQRRAETQSKLLQAAAELICEKGYAALTTADIADRAGLTRGAIQHHFGNKDDVCIALVDEFGYRLDSAGDESVAAPADMRSRIDAAIDGYWRSFSDPRYVAVVLVSLSFLRDKKLYSRLAERLNRFEQQFDLEWQSRFRDTGLEDGQIAAARHIVVSALRGFSIRSVYRKERAADWTQEINILKEMVLAFFVGRGR